MPSEANHSAVFLRTAGYFHRRRRLDGAMSKSGSTALQDTRTEPPAGDLSSREITSTSQRHHENGFKLRCPPSHIIPAPVKMVQETLRTNMTHRSSLLAIGGISIFGISVSPAVVANSLILGQEETVALCTQRNLTQNDAGELQDCSVLTSGPKIHEKITQFIDNGPEIALPAFFTCKSRFDALTKLSRQRSSRPCVLPCRIHQ